MNQTTPPTTSTTPVPSLDRRQTLPQLRKPVIVHSPTTAPKRATARHRRARAAILWGVLVVALANVALAGAVETALPQLRDPEYGYRLVRLQSQQRAHPDRPLVVMVGTSRTQNAMDVSAMGFSDEAGSPLLFNLGQSGSNPVRQRLTLQRLTAEGIRPSAVLVEVFPPSLIIPAPMDEHFQESVAKLTFADIERLEPYLANPQSLRKRWMMERLNTWNAQQPVLFSHLVPNWQPWHMRIDHQWELLDSFGFSRYPDHKANEHRAERVEKVRVQYSATMPYIHVSELTIRAYRDLVADCRLQGIPVAFVVLPESPTFRSWYPPQSREAVTRFLRSIREEWNCPVFEAGADFPEEDFADGHHMLPAGAARFSRNFADTHLKAWLAEVVK